MSLPEDLMKKLYSTINPGIGHPNHPSLRLKRVQGTKDIWEASVNMPIRITLIFSEDTLQLRERWHSRTGFQTTTKNPLPGLPAGDFYNHIALVR